MNPAVSRWYRGQLRGSATECGAEALLPEATHSAVSGRIKAALTANLVVLAGSFSGEERR